MIYYEHLKPPSGLSANKMGARIDYNDDTSHIEVQMWICSSSISQKYGCFISFPTGLIKRF